MLVVSMAYPEGELGGGAQLPLNLPSSAPIFIKNPIFIEKR